MVHETFVAEEVTIRQETVTRTQWLACRLLQDLLHIQSGRLRNIDAKLSRHLDRQEDLEVEDN